MLEVENCAMTSVGIVDVGISNLGSIERILSGVADCVRIVRKPAEIDQVDRLVLPGVGAFPQAMNRLGSTGLSLAIKRFAQDRRGPVLGICLGMQLLAAVGEEHELTSGLNLIDGKVRKLSAVRVPHVGWNAVEIRLDCALMEGIPSGTDFYFVHSYVFDPVNEQSLVATATHGERFSAVLVDRNIAGVQFHPEKSSRAGRRLLQNFCRWLPC